MLGAVWIARPEYEHEGLLASLEDRQHRFRRDIRKKFLLLDVGDQRAGDRAATRAGVGAPGRRLRWQLGRAQLLLEFIRQRYAAGPTGHVIHHKGLLTGTLRMVENQGGPKFANGRR